MLARRPVCSRTLGRVDTQSAWDPDQYARFATERRQPFFDLLALVAARPGMRVADLGCGTGELTRLLHQRLQARETVGVDSSPAMLTQSREYAGNGVRFVQADLRDFVAEGSYDLIFSNAALHWVPGHEDLLRRLTASLGEDGQLSVHVPANDDHPSHQVAAAVAAEGPFRDALSGYTRPDHVLEPEAYATLLDRLGYRQQHVRLQVYAHHLSSREEVVEWVKGSLLTDYRSRLAPELYRRFIERYRERLLPRLADVRPYFYSFKRILFWSRR